MLLDEQVMPVYMDAASMTHAQIFNLLTNDGAIKGIYQEGNQLYINATYIKSGEINAGLITTGTLDASKATITNLNASNIKSGTLDASVVTVKNLNATNITSGTLKDANGNFSLNLSTGAVAAKKFSISSSAFTLTESGVLSSIIGSQKLTISEADLKGYYGSTLYGQLDLCAQYEDGKKHASLRGVNYLHLQAGTRVAIEVNGTEVAYATSSKFYANGATIGTCAIPTGFNSDGTAKSWYTCSFTSGILYFK